VSSIFSLFGVSILDPHFFVLLVVVVALCEDTFCSGSFPCKKLSIFPIKLSSCAGLATCGITGNCLGTAGTVVQADKYSVKLTIDKANLRIFLISHFVGTGLKGFRG